MIGDEVGKERGIWYIPGDQLSFELGDFAHQQHIRFVRVIYALGSDLTQQVLLEGVPEESVPPRRDSTQRVVYTSKVRVSGAISWETKPGRYRLQAIGAHTAGRKTREFQATAERATFPLPQYILIQPEPSEGPIFL